MAKITFLTGPNVSLNFTADDWQLYRMDGRADVAAQLNKTIEERVAVAPTLKDFDPSGILEPFDKFGADDTEGRYMLEYILQQIYK